MSDMEEILAELQRMIEVNPEAYQKIMESMSKALYSSGTNTNDDLPQVTTSGISSNDGVKSGSFSQGNMSINQMAEAIMHMRNASIDVEGKESDLIMSKDKPKQVLLFMNINDDIRSADHFMILMIMIMIMMIMMMIIMMMIIIIIIIIAFVITSLHYIDIAKRNPHNSNSWLYI
jgi:hypothetical protein